MSDWPEHQSALRPWQQQYRGGTRDDRTFAEVKVSLPPLIAAETVPTDGALVATMERAIGEIVALDLSHGDQLDALGALLLRSESVASSKIESIEASIDDFARAMHGSRANASAVSMIAATEALEILIDRAGATGHIDLASVLTSHRALMALDSDERDYAGVLRDVQNWIGGSDHSPRNAIYVPPPPGSLDRYMADLLQFANRDDVPVVAQAAVVHAQFESIHPFTDGNGRVGRGLINAVLRRRRTTSRVVVPLASALVAHRERYFDNLNHYRLGDPRPLIASFAESSRIASEESRGSAVRLAEIPAEWGELVGRVRADSAAAKLLGVLPRRPVLSTSDAVSLVAAPMSSVYAAVERLHDSGVLRPLTDRKRDQVWGASLILDELDDLGTRIEAAAR